MIKDLVKQRLKNLIASSKKKISYSQCGEDMIIAHLFMSLGMQEISYLDIGAHDPHWLSNTAYFYDHGSRGINVEPDLQGFKKFEKYRKKDLNLHCGVGAEDGELDFYVMNVPTLNTFLKEEAEELVANHGFTINEKLKLKVYSVSTILEKYNNGKFPELLSLDVEGLDEKIIKSLNWKDTKPLVICLETISYSTSGTGRRIWILLII